MNVSTLTAAHCARGHDSEQIDQESRSAGRRAATTVTAMDITIDASIRPHDREAKSPSGRSCCQFPGQPGVPPEAG
jgi:hypothetical protein